MTPLRDYDAWHEQYDDPGSALSWRLGQVQDRLRAALDERSGPLRILSVCSGDGRDVIEVLAERSDSDRVEAILIEVHREIAGRARQTATDAGLEQVEVRHDDAGESDSYLDAVPADIVLLVGIMGNIAREDIDRLVDTAPQLCRPGGLLLWSRGLHDESEDVNAAIRARFVANGFSDLSYAEHDRAAIGAVRYDGPLIDLVPGQQIFTFVR